MTLRPLVPGVVFSGPAMPVTHLGSVDVILETIDDSSTGGVLVVGPERREELYET